MKITESGYELEMKVQDQIEVETFYPSLEEIDEMEKDPDRWIFLAIYLYEHGEKPETKDEEYRRKTLLHFINEHLEIVDDEIFSEA